MDEHAYCPHCRQLLLEHAPHPFPSRPVRCSGCRLLVGPGRSRDANGRARRFRASAAPTGDTVALVLQDIRAQEDETTLRGITGEMPALRPPGSDADGPLVTG